MSLIVWNKLKWNLYQNTTILCNQFANWEPFSLDISKLAIVGLDHGLSPDRRQAIIWTNDGILLIDYRYVFRFVTAVVTMPRPWPMPPPLLGSPALWSSLTPPHTSNEPPLKVTVPIWSSVNQLFTTGEGHLRACIVSSIHFCNISFIINDNRDIWWFWCQKQVPNLSTRIPHYIPRSTVGRFTVGCNCLYML